MLSAGLLGGPGIGFFQDQAASASLQKDDAQVYERYKASGPNSFLWMETVGLDGAKVGVLDDNGQEAQRALQLLEKQEGVKEEALQNQRELVEWWNTSAEPNAENDEPLVSRAGLQGGREALKLTAFVPGTMAVCYVLLIGLFGISGGYKQKTLDPELFTGGAEGPGEA
jgi:hypothetical protein